MKPIARALIALPVVLVPLACGSSPPQTASIADAGANDAASSETDDSASPTPPTQDASVDAAPIAFDAGTTYVRLVNLSPDAPAIDFCYAPGENTDFHGPVLHAAGVAYAHASEYLALPANSYDVRIVAAGSTDCSTSIGVFSTSLSTLDDGEHTSLVASGDVSVVGGDVAFGLHDYTDDASSPVSGDVALRFVDSSSASGAIEFGEGALASSSFTPLFDSTTSSSEGTPVASDAGSFDANDYVAIAPPSAITVSAHASGAASDLVAAKETATAGEAVTVFLIGGKTGDASHPSQLLACDDGVTPSGAPSSCSLLAM